MQMIDFSGKTILVTGGGAGIGRAVAEAFGACGARVAITEIDASRCASARDALAAAGVEALVIECDVRDRDAVDGAMQDIDARFGGLDIVVNNVGDALNIFGPFETNSDADFDALYETNLRSTFLVSRAAIPLLRKRGPGGSIINISSIEAFRGIPVCTVYCAFKHAITGFTRSLALELAPAGIRVNAIAPETTETEQVKPSLMIAEEHRQHIDRWIPLGRFGMPEDAAGCALFLASDLAGWVTGTTINLDGGALAAGGWYRDPNGQWTIVPVVTGNGFNL